jgi:hypothetical protein
MRDRQLTMPAGVDEHVLDGNFLLPLPSIALQCLGLGREGSQQFHSEISVAVLIQLLRTLRLAHAVVKASPILTKRNFQCHSRI